MAKETERIVLIVEDEVLIRMSEVDAFSDFGFAVIEAQHSAAAIVVALDNPRIDLLFTDVNMPGEMDGISLAEHLFALRPLLKIIVTSAIPLVREIGHLNGHFLPKPYDVAGLSQISEGLLAG